MTVWCVVADTGGAHEAECVYSIWQAKASAEAEMARLIAADVCAGCNGGDFYVAEYELDTPRDEWIA